MTSINFPDWIKENHPHFVRLTDAVQLIMKNLLNDAGVSYLTVEGRTKSEDDCKRKAHRKNYRNPVEELTDISGIRIVVYFDYDVQSVGELIEANFNVDKKNSSNRDDLLSVNEVGYRSVHYVCGLGDDRTKLQEHKRFKGLKFEFQVRTVLQHAWAELAHDRNYKFSGQLPKPIERKLFLLAGLMETADNGFSDLSKEVDTYISQVSESTSAGELPTEINSITIEEFVKQWAKSEGFEIEELQNRDGYKDLIRELYEYEVYTINDLKNIIPKNYKNISGAESSTVYGFVRDWMITFDPDRFVANVNAHWSVANSDMRKYRKFMTEAQLAAIGEKIDVFDDEDFDDNEFTFEEED